MARKLTTTEKTQKLFAEGHQPKNVAKAAFRRVLLDALIASTVDAETVDEVWSAVDDAAELLANTRAAVHEGVTGRYGGDFSEACDAMDALRERLSAHAGLVPTRVEPTDLGDALRRAFGGG